MSELPEGRTIHNSAAEHVADHNELARLHNLFDGTFPGGQTTILADDEDVTVPASPGTTVVLYTALTTNREVVLPLAASDPMTIVIKDVSGNAATDADISIATDENVDGGGPNSIRSPFGEIIIVNDGVDTWVKTPTPLGGTDGDGNVYSVVFDGDRIKVRCVKTDGSEAFVLVGPESAQVRYSDVPDDVVNGVVVGPEGVNVAAGTDGDGNVYSIEYDPAAQLLSVKVVAPNGDFARAAVNAGSSNFVDAQLYAQTEDNSTSHSVQVSPTEVQIDGVTVDPSLPWPSGTSGYYGDGSDGTRTFDGSTTILSHAPSSNIYTLTRDLFLADWTVNNGVTIITAGFRINWTGTLTNNGTIHNDGIAGAPFTGGAAGAGPGTVAGVGTPGANGATGTGGNSSAKTSSLGGRGGAGGFGSLSTQGTSGTVTAPTAATGTLRSLPYAAVGALISGTAVAIVNGGTGGGGGGGDGSHNSGGGGGGGGLLVLCGKTIAGTGAIRARGGVGGAGSFTGTGGGGGGGGGWLCITSGSVNAGAIAGQTIDANGGTGGTHTGSAPTTDGSSGANGTVILIQN